MRSLRSGRTKDVANTIKTNKKSENTNNKMCNKRLKSNKLESRKERPVLADRTNSDLDTNSSSNVSTTTTRPKRTHNIPARFQDHEISPIKNYRPECSSTPLIEKKRTPLKTATPTKVKTRSRLPKENKAPIHVNSKDAEPIVSEEKHETPCVSILEKKSTAKSTPIYKRGMKQKINVTKNESHNVTPLHKKSIAVLEKPKIQTPDRMALYEFDFDPSEEPAQAKKKKPKKTQSTKKRVPKPNTAKDDAALQVLIEKLKRIQERQKCKKLLEKKKACQPSVASSSVVPTINVPNTDMELNNELHAASQGPDLRECLSPIPRHIIPCTGIPEALSQNNSFTTNRNDLQSSTMSGSPVASSSMIMGSVRKSVASPWRVNIDAGSKNWPLNFHVKPSMTPAYDKDTVHVIGLSGNNLTNLESDKSKHKYTNISINSSHNQEEELEKKLASWKQTSILSFYEESFKRSGKKRCHSPKKVDSYDFSDLVPETNELCDSINESQEKALPKDTEIPTLDNCFGFDDSSEQDQENVSPAKISKIQNINTVRGTFKKARRCVLKESNQNLPMRVLPKDVLNIIEKQKFMEDIDDPHHELPIDQFPELNQKQDSDDSFSDSDGEVHPLYEQVPAMTSQDNDVELFAEPVEPELVHFFKPSRKSYETRKRGQLTFFLPDTTKEKSFSDPESDDSCGNVTKSKKVVKRKKKQNTKANKEEKRIDDWAAGFNSMLEEVEDFPLVVE